MISQERNYCFINIVTLLLKVKMSAFFKYANIIKDVLVSKKSSKKSLPSILCKVSSVIAIFKCNAAKSFHLISQLKARKTHFITCYI